MRFFYFVPPVLALFLLSLNARSQQADNWFFPEKAGITFRNGVPEALLGGRIFTPDPNNMSLRPTESGACMSDSKGNLLFYTDGLTVWNRNHVPMKNGTGLMGGLSSTQPATIVPDPGNSSKYYIFTTDDFQHVLMNGFRYSVVDLCLDGGLGDVTSEKNVLLAETVAEKQAITKHANDTDYWVVTHKHFTDAFYAFRITKNGVQQPVVTRIGRIHEGGLFAGTASAIGQMKISPDGKKIALVNANNGVGMDNAIFEVFDFNRQTGVLSNYVNLTAIIRPVFFGFYGAYGLAFSPGGKFIYITGTIGIVQLKYDAGWTYVDRIFTPSIVLNANGGMQLAPDGKIYIAKGESFLASIAQPDSSIPACNFILNDVFLGDAMGTQSLPSFYDGFRYTHPDPGCPVTPIDPGDTSRPGVPSGCQTDLFPNPANDVTHARSYYTALKEIEIYDAAGRMVKHYTDLEVKELAINLDQFADGCYAVVIIPQKGDRCIKRLIKIGK